MSAPDREVAEAVIEKSRDSLSDAEFLVEEERSIQSIVNRAYYAAYSAARAGLELEGERPNTHSGVISRFSFRFVRSGRISDELGSVLGSAESMRVEADYELQTSYNREDAEDLTRQVRRFVETVVAECDL
jgi:uncharacterized protein (UPF0332 family)